MIPNLGATIAGFILVPVILAEEGLTAALIMLAVVLIYQQVENNVMTPKVQGKAVNLSGFFIIVSVTLFGALLGVLGALTAVPLAAMIQIFFQELTKARASEDRRSESGPRAGSRRSGRPDLSRRSPVRHICPRMGHCAYGVVGLDRRSGAAAAGHDQTKGRESTDPTGRSESVRAAAGQARCAAAAARPRRAHRARRPPLP